MKVIIVNRFYAPDQSATSRMCTSLALGLLAVGFEVEAIASATLHDDPRVVLPRREIVDGVMVLRVAGTRFGRGRLAGRALDYLSFHVGAAWLLLRRASRHSACIVCTDPPLMAVSAWPAIKARGARFVNWLHDIFPEVAFEAGVLRSQGVIGRTALAARNAMVRAADANVAPTRSMAEGVRQDDPSTRVDVIAQWSDGETIAPRPPCESALRRECGLGDALVIGYSGNLGRAHDFATLVDAASILRHDGRIRFLIVGGGHRLGWLRRETERRGLSNFIFKPLQPVERLADCLAAADVHFVTLLPRFERLIVPSKFYGVAAAGRGALFVGAADGEIASLLARHGCGAAFDVGDAAGLADQIHRLAEDRTIPSAWGRAARTLFDARFSRQRGVADWRALVDRVCGSGAAAGDEVGLRDAAEEAA